MTDAVVVAARRLFDFVQDKGHELRPVKPEDRHFVQAANDADRSRPPSSLDCWDCRGPYHDQRIDAYSTTDLRTWADHDHQKWEAWKALREALDAIESSS